MRNSKIHYLSATGDGCIEWIIVYTTFNAMHSTSEQLVMLVLTNMPAMFTS